MFRGSLHRDIPKNIQEMKFLTLPLLALLVVCSQTRAQTYTIEIYIAVDTKVIEMYAREIPGADNTAKRAQALDEFRKDLNYVVAEASKLIETLNRYGLNIELRVRELNILNTNIFSSSVILNGNNIHEDDAIKEFSDWLTARNTYSVYDYDVAMLLTGFEIYGASGIYTMGVANIGGVCDPSRAVGVMEFNATYAAAIIFARQVALLLGSGNDGAASQKIMALSNNAKDKDRWDFSECTASDIKEFLPLLKSNCLLRTNRESTKPLSNWNVYSGKIFNKDVICQRAKNNLRSYACLLPSLYNTTVVTGDAICGALYCNIPGTSLCSHAFQSEGFVCDKNKRCNRGKCEFDSSYASANVDASCVLGNQKEIQITGFSPFSGTCQELIAQKGQLVCYNDAIAQMCCATCNQVKKNTPGCEYGDKNVICPDIPKSVACAARNVAVCCNTCQGYVNKRSTYEDGDLAIINEGFGDIKGDTYRIL